MPDIDNIAIERSVNLKPPPDSTPNSQMVPSDENPSSEVSDIQDGPYSIYSRRDKWIIVTMVALAGLYSPLPANIYFPAIPTLSKEFSQSIDTINQSVTIYLVFQGLGECRLLGLDISQNLLT